MTRPQILETIDLVEYQGEPISRQRLSFLNAEGLEECSRAFSQLVAITPDFHGEHVVFKAGSRVGVLSGYGLRVQVCPRVSAREFCTLLRYALNGRVSPESLRSHEELSWEKGFEDALCTLLCLEMQSILRDGISRRYVEYREPLEVIRGRILWQRNFPWLGGKVREITCRYHRMTYDNLDNRLILRGLSKAFNLAGALSVRQSVGNHLNIFRSIASEAAVSASDFQTAERGYNRLNEHYRVAHALCRMLLFGLRPEELFEEGREEVFGVVVDMADIFERFVERFLVDCLGPQGFKLVLQARDSRAILDGEGHKYSNVQPDIEVWRRDRPIGVVDAKYKPYWATGSDHFSPDRKISNEDLYQLFFYQQRMQRKYGLPQLPKAVIASPLPEEDEREERGTVAGRFRKLRWQAGAEREGDVRLVLIPITGFLRLLNQRVEPLEAIRALQAKHILRLFEPEGAPAVFH